MAFYNLGPIVYQERNFHQEDAKFMTWKNTWTASQLIISFVLFAKGKCDFTFGVKVKNFMLKSWLYDLNVI